jgi:hypothetical protein
MDGEIAKVEARKKTAEEISTIEDKMWVQILPAPEPRGVN